MDSVYYKINELLKLIEQPRHIVDCWMNKNHPAYDPTFPPPVPVGRKATAWRKSDIDKWLFDKQMDAIDVAHNEAQNHLALEHEAVEQAKQKALEWQVFERETERWRNSYRRCEPLSYRFVRDIAAGFTRWRKSLRRKWGNDYMRGYRVRLVTPELFEYILLKLRRKAV